MIQRNHFERFEIHRKHGSQLVVGKKVKLTSVGYNCLFQTAQTTCFIYHSVLRFHECCSSKYTQWYRTLQSSCSQTCSSRYPNQGSNYVLLPTNKNFSHFMSKFLLQWSLIIQNNNVVWFCVTPQESHISPGGNLPPIWEPLLQSMRFSVAEYW